MTTVSNSTRSAPARTNLFRSTPGIELVFEAFDDYWRKTPAVKRIVMRVIPDEATRLAALKGGEVDIAYSIRGDARRGAAAYAGPDAEAGCIRQAPFWVYFPDQWDPKSPWHELRVRQAANLALDRDAMNKALFLGFCKTTNSIIPASFEFYWQPPAAVYDPAKAKQLLAEAGYPNGFDGGPITATAPIRISARPRSTISRQIGIRCTLQPLERAGFHRRLFRKEIQQRGDPGGERRLRQRRHPARGVFRQGRRLCLWQLSRYRRAVSSSRRASSTIRNAVRSSAKIQQLVYEKAIYAPIWQLAFLNGVGPRVGESGFGLHPKASPIPGRSRTSP